jgi:YHS domain-containing protein
MTRSRIRTWLPAFIGALLSATLATPAAPAAAQPHDHAGERDTSEVCLVCHFREGTVTPEPVRATREFEGVRYGFCSRACAVAFDEDPRRYLAAGGSAIDSMQVVPLVDFGAARAATAPT